MKSEKKMFRKQWKLTMMKYFCHINKRDFHSSSRKILSKTMIFFVQVVTQKQYLIVLFASSYSRLAHNNKGRLVRSWVDEAKRKIIIMFPDTNLSN
jgi:hypothetical protein